MPNQYDRIVKENIDKTVFSIAEKLFDLDVKWQSDVKDKIQTTVEREIDYLKKGILTKTNEEVMLQFEFETKASRIKLNRMLLYFALVYDKFKLPVKQFVIYIGKEKLPKKVKNKLEFDNLKYSFEVKDIRTIPYQTFLNSESAEEVILSILCDFKDETPEAIIEKVFNRLILIKKDVLGISKYIYQLRVLANLRNLHLLIENKIKNMPITIDMSKDTYFLQGIEQGIDKMIIELVKDGVYPVEKIARLAQVEVSYVLKIKESLTPKKK